MDDSFQRRELDDPFLNESYPELGQIDPPNHSLECDALSPSLWPNPALGTPDVDSAALPATSPASPQARHGSANQQPLEQLQADPEVCPTVRVSSRDQPDIQSRQTYPTLVPGQAAEQVTRYKRNMRCSCWPVKQSQNEMAEAGFIISDDESYFFCQYCSYPLTIEALRYDCDLWIKHFEECNHLHMHHLEQTKKGRDTCNHSVPQLSSAMQRGQQSTQLTCNIPGGQQSGNISGQSAGAVSSAFFLQEAVIAEIVQQQQSQNAMGSKTGSQPNNICQNTQWSQFVSGSGGGAQILCTTQNPETEIIATDAEGCRYTLRGPVKYRQNAEYIARLKTFSKVPSSVVKKPKELASAGFMYAGTEDRVICFSCGGGFRNWQHADDPWKEHARMFPDCTYITHVKGFQFVQQAVASVVSASDQTMTQATNAASCNNQQSLESMTNGSVLSLEKNNKYPTDKELGLLSRNIGKEHVQLGLELDLQFCRIQQIEVEYHTVSNRCLAILTEWRSAQADRATLGDLEKVFRKLNIDTMIFTQL